MSTRALPMTDETKLVLERFSNYLYARCGLAETSIALMSGYVRRLIPDMGLNPSASHLEQLVADMRRRKVSYAALTNALKAIERYMEFLGKPTRFGRPRKPQKAEIKVLSEAKITLMIASAHTLREKAILALMAYSGCRNNELIALRVSDVDIPQQALVIREGKGAKGRICCLSGDCAEVVSEYLRERKGEAEDWLFVTVRHKHQLQTQDIRKLVRVIAKRAGIPGRVWPHLLRHSLATALLSRGASVYSIQAILGHSDVNTTTAFYLHPAIRTVRADYQRCVPSFL